LKKTDIYDSLINASGTNIPLKDGSFDSVIAAEVLEHLGKDKGYVFIDEAKRVTAKRLIITTPNFKDFRPGIEGLDGYNRNENHLSIWTVSELRSLGFKCYGVGTKWMIHPLLYTMLSSLTYPFPRLSRYIIGIYDK